MIRMITNVTAAGTSAMRRTAVAALLLSALCIFLAPPGPALADEDLPKAETVLDRYAEVTGGMENYDKITNRVVHAMLEIPSQGISLAVTVYSQKPTMYYSVAESASLGKIERGCDGDVVWENSIISGPFGTGKIDRIFCFVIFG